MKKFLKTLQAIQDECLARSKDETESKPENLERPMVRSVSFEIGDKKWKTIQTNLAEHAKDWRRFRKDPNKVVIEKNLLFNSLIFMPDFFLFRTKEDDDCDATFINTTSEFIDLRPVKKTNWLILTFIIVAMLGLYFIFAGALNRNISIFFAVIYVLIIFLVASKVNERHRLKLANWQRVLREDPGILFKRVITSKRELNNRDFGYIESLIQINLRRSHFFSSNYQKIIYKSFGLANKMKSEISWLWYFGEATRNKDLFEVKNLDNESSGSYSPIKITLGITGSNILPVIETEHSFIFCLDDFSDKMDEFGNTGEQALLKIRKKMIDPTGNIGKYDMFRPYYFT